MTATAHARLAPSSAHRWGPHACPASPVMEAQYPEDEESEAAREGTAAHWVLEQHEPVMAGASVDPLPCSVGTLAPNGHPVTVEMIEGVQPLIDDVASTLRSATPGLVVRIEERVDASETVHPDVWGTTDIFLLDRPAKRLHIWDYKFGHRPVDPFHNWQLIAYAACILESEGVPYGACMTDWNFTFTIHQPRSPGGSLKEWHASGREVVPLINELRTAAYDASKPDTPCRTGEHCRDCAAQTHCVANQRVGGAGIDITYAAQTISADPHAWGLEKRMIDQALQRLKARSDALDASIMGALRAGQRVPFYGIGSTQPRMKWKDGMGAQAALVGDMYGVELRKPEPALITPNEAIKKGIDASVISTYAETPPGAPKLVARDDSDAMRTFGPR